MNAFVSPTVKARDREELGYESIEGSSFCVHVYYCSIFHLIFFFSKIHVDIQFMRGLFSLKTVVLPHQTQNNCQPADSEHIA